MAEKIKGEIEMALYTCKKCGKQVPIEYATCPFCGTPRPEPEEEEEPKRKKKKKHPILRAIFVIFVIIIVVSAIGGDKDDEPTKVGDIGSSQSTSKGEDVKPEKTEEKTVFGVGEQVNLNDVVVTLVDATENEGKDFFTPEDGNVFVVFEFEIENNSSKDINISSIVSFEAYVDDYSINQSITATSGSSKGQLDGSVAAGKKMNGVIGYEVSKDWKTLEIKFTPDFWSQKDITFVYSK